MSDAANPSVLHVIGTAIAMVLSGGVSWYVTKHKRAVSEAESRLEVSANDVVGRALLRLDSEIRELKLEIADGRRREEEAREREKRLRKYIHILIGVMREAGIAPPEYFDTEDENARG